MMKHSTLLLTIAITISTPLTAARDIPANIQAFYDKVTTQSQCDETLASGFTSISGEDDSPSPPPPLFLSHTITICKS